MIYSLMTIFANGQYGVNFCSFTGEDGIDYSLIGIVWDNTEKTLYLQLCLQTIGFDFGEERDCE